jgi:hypothetical protein
MSSVEHITEEEEKMQILIADVILLYGSKFGATRITGSTLPEPVSSCL